jgi:hypothetical protein
MSALLFIQNKRKSLERIDLVDALRLAVNGSSERVERVMMRWAREAEINLFMEE